MSALLRDRLLADHRRLETLYERWLAIAGAGDRPEMARLWTELDSELLEHMQAEETHLIPPLQRVSATSARILMQEHRHIRGRLLEIGVEVSSGCVRLDTARTLIDELRAHGRSEDRLLYQWAEERLGETERALVLGSLLERLPSMRVD